MKKLIFLLFFLITSFSDKESHGILNINDYKMAEEDNLSPAIRIPSIDGTSIQSFNEWRCFPAKLVTLNTTHINYDGWKDLPRIEIELDYENVLNYELDPDVNWNSEDIIYNWRKGIDYSQTICIFGAYLQSHENEHIFYIEKIKFEINEWSRSEEIEAIDSAKIAD